jgi:replicative DNA helicase
MDPSVERAKTLVRTGYHRLDRGGGVLHRGHLTVLAGAPSMGKSALAMGMILGVCEPEESTAVYFTSFYENGDLLLRLLAATGGVSPARASQRCHGIGAFVEQALRRGLYLHQGAGLMCQSSQVAAQARDAAQRSPGLAALAIDPLLTCTPAMRAGPEERRATIESIRELALELNVAVLLVVALPSSVKGARPKRTQLRSLGFEPGIADTELLLHRPSVYQKLAPPALTEVVVYERGEDEPRLASLRYLPAERRFVG